MISMESVVMFITMFMVLICKTFNNSMKCSKMTITLVSKHSQLHLLDLETDHEIQEDDLKGDLKILEGQGTE